MSDQIVTTKPAPVPLPAGPSKTSVLLKKISKVVAGVLTALTSSSVITAEKNLKAVIATGGLLGAGSIFALVELVQTIVKVS